MRKKGQFCRELGAKGCGICATNLAEMARTIALRSASWSATELRLETLVVPIYKKILILPTLFNPSSILGNFIYKKTFSEFEIHLNSVLFVLTFIKKFNSTDVFIKTLRNLKIILFQLKTIHSTDIGEISDCLKSSLI